MPTETKPARQMIARAVENKAGAYLAEFAYPGVVPDFVRNGDEPAVYPTAWEAEFDALRTLRDAYNSREHYRRTDQTFLPPTNDELAEALALANIMPAEWAALWGTRQSRVLDQIKGLQHVPFAARWILAIFAAFPDALALARKIAAEHTSGDIDSQPVESHGRGKA